MQKLFLLLLCDLSEMPLFMGIMKNFFGINPACYFGLIRLFEVLGLRIYRYVLFLLFDKISFVFGRGYLSIHIFFAI